MTTIKELKKQFADGEIDHLQFANGVVKRKQYVKDQKQRMKEQDIHIKRTKWTEELMATNPDTFNLISDKERSIEYLLSFIENDQELTDYTNDILRNKVPDYFWNMPSGSSGKYHPNDERGYYGLVLHTMRVTKVVHEIVNFKNVVISTHDRNITIVAAILHDTLKYDIDPVRSYTVEEHPLIACEYLDLPDEISRIIRSHYGDWFTPHDYNEMDDMQRALYFADGISSREYVTVHVTE